MHPNEMCALCRGDKDTGGGFYVCICTTACGSSECQYVSTAKDEAPAVSEPTTGAPVLTTAQRLSAYYDELIEAGFNTDSASQMTLRAAPTDLVDVEIQADLEDAQPHAVVHVRMVAEVDRESLDQAVEKVRRFVSPEGGPDA